VAVTNPNTNLNAPVQLNATVAGTSGTPVGTLTFYDGTTALGSSLVSGSTTTAVATLMVSTLMAGVHTITAQFTGVNGYSNSTSSPVTETITAPALTEAFASPSLTVFHGGSGTTSLVFNPLGGYTGTTTVACGTLPAHVSCSFSSSTLTFTGNNTPQTVQLTLNADTMTARLVRTNLNHAPGDLVLAAGSFPFLVLLSLAGIRRRRSALRMAGSALTVLLLSAAAVGMTGCSGDPNAAASGSYTIPVSVTSNGTTTSITLTLIVQ
jgi:hypothetical protein